MMIFFKASVSGSSLEANESKVLVDPIESIESAPNGSRRDLDLDLDFNFEFLSRDCSIDMISINALKVPWKCLAFSTKSE